LKLETLVFTAQKNFNAFALWLKLVAIDKITISITFSSLPNFDTAILF